MPRRQAVNAVSNDWTRVTDVTGLLSRGESIGHLLKAKELAHWRRLEAHAGPSVLSQCFSAAFSADGKWVETFGEIMEIARPRGHKLTAEECIAPFTTYVRRRLCDVPGYPANCPWEPLTGKLEKDLFRLAAHALRDFFEKEEPRAGTDVQDFYNRFPVLARMLTCMCADWLEGKALFTRRLIADGPAFPPLFAPGITPGRVSAILPMSSDIHSGDGEVLKICFENGDAIVYKPRSAAAEASLSRAARKINQLAGETFLYAPEVVLREGYYWQQWISQDEITATNKEIVLKDAGRFIALCNLLLMEDYHAENVRVSRGRFLGLDNEFFFPPLSPVQQNYALIKDPALREGFFCSVYCQKTLPDLFSHFYHDFRDTFGLGNIGYTFRAAERDRVREGFRELHGLFEKHAEVLSDFLRGEIRTGRSRYMVRQTAHYYALAAFATTGEALSNSFNFFFALAGSLFRSENASPVEARLSFLTAELRDLAAGRIPAFYVGCEEEKNIPGWKSGLARHREQTENWCSPAFIEKQLLLLDYALDSGSDKLFANAFDGKSPHYETVAHNIADFLALLFSHLDCASRAMDHEPGYAGFREGILGVSVFLAMADSKKPGGAVRAALEKLLARCEAELNEKNTARMSPDLLADIAEGIGQLAMYHDAPVVHRLKERIGQIGKTQPVMAPVGFSPITHDVSGEWLNSDDWPGGNFGKIDQLLCQGQQEQARAYCDALLQSRRRTGFVFGKRGLNPFIAHGLAGIGRTLFRLGA